MRPGTPLCETCGRRPTRSDDHRRCDRCRWGGGDLDRDDYRDRGISDRERREGRFGR